MIRKIGKEDAYIVHQLAERTWPDTFKDILSPNQIRYMLDWMYEVSFLQEQIEEGHIFALFELDNQPLGFIACEKNHPEKDSLKIHKIYVLPESQGTGAGKALMNYAIDLAKSNGFKKVKLNVNRYNNAVSFYEHLGFKITLKEDIDIGEGYLMEDYRMELELS